MVGSKQAACRWCSHCTGCCWLFCICKVTLQGGLHGQAGLLLQGEQLGRSSWAGQRWSHPWWHLWGQCGTRVTPGSSKRGCLGLAVQLRCWAECVESCRVAGKCPSAVFWPGHPLGPRPKGSTGLGGGFCRGPLPALPAAPGELTVTEPVLSQRSAITHSRKPRQLLSVPRRAGPRARESVVHEGLLAPRRPPCWEVPRSPDITGYPLRGPLHHHHPPRSLMLAPVGQKPLQEMPDYPLALPEHDMGSPGFQGEFCCMMGTGETICRFSSWTTFGEVRVTGGSAGPGHGLL